MNKKLLIIIFLTLVVSALSYILIRPSASDTAKQSTLSPSSNPNGTQTNPTTSEDRGGSYITYSEGVIEQTPRRKLLFFHAPWCPQCRAIEADILRDGVPTGLHVIKVDYDGNQALRQKYGVTIQTTFVELDDEGNAIEKFVAYDQPTFKSVTLNFLSK
jgi:thiol-disulfide isomerase/thioredoxin